jgi:hypothetical protein
MSAAPPPPPPIRGVPPRVPPPRTPSIWKFVGALAVIAGMSFLILKMVLCIVYQLIIALLNPTSSVLYRLLDHLPLLNPPPPLVSPMSLNSSPSYPIHSILCPLLLPIPLLSISSFLLTAQFSKSNIPGGYYFVTSDGQKTDARREAELQALRAKKSSLEAAEKVGDKIDKAYDDAKNVLESKYKKGRSEIEKELEKERKEIGKQVEVFFPFPQ